MNTKLKQFSKDNRNNPTKAESKIWYDLLSSNKLGYKFLRQRIIDNFIVDFYCHKLKLIIEVDGDSHEDLKKNKRRDIKLNELGYKVMIFTRGSARKYR